MDSHTVKSDPDLSKMDQFRTLSRIRILSEVIAAPGVADPDSTDQKIQRTSRGYMLQYSYRYFS